MSTTRQSLSPRQAVTLLAESLTLRREIGDAGGIAWCLEKLAEIALSEGERESAPRRHEDFRQAARLFGAAEALRAPIGSVMDSVDQPEYERQLAILRLQLDEAAFAAAWAEGQAKTLEQAAVQLGATLPSPFSTLSFVALPVIPELRLTDLGLVDVNEFRLIK